MKNKNCITVFYFVGLMLALSSCTVTYTTKRRYDETYKSPFEITRVDTFVGSRAELFTRANIWLTGTFKSAKSLIQMHDKEAGVIIAKCGITSTSAIGNNVNGMKEYKTDYIDYTISIYVKPERVRISFSDFYYNGYSLSNEKPPVGIDDNRWANIRGDSYNEAMVLRKDFKKFMKGDPLSW